MSSIREPVLWVNHTSALGGGELGLQRVLELDASDSPDSLVVFQHGPLSDRALQLKVPTTVLDWDGTRGISLVETIRRVSQIISEFPGNVVIANSMIAARILRFVQKSGKYFVCYLQESMSSRNLSIHLRAYYYNVVLPYFDAYLSNSEWTQSTLPRRLHRRPVKLVYSMSGIDESFVDDVKRDRESLHGSRDPTILHLLYLGRLSEGKGIETLLSALEHLGKSSTPPRIVTTIAGGALFGEKEYAKRLQRQAAGVGLTVLFSGFSPDIVHLLASNDILVCPSSRPEAFGQVIVQALAAGLPVISTAQGGPCELINEGKTGFFFEPGSARDLARVLRRISLSLHSLHDRSELCRESARPYWNRPVLERFDKAILDLQEIAKSSRRRG
jgi:glycosyltransferase involved in cell wall biosynthesis